MMVAVTGKWVGMGERKDVRSLLLSEGGEGKDVHLSPCSHMSSQRRSFINRNRVKTVSAIVLNLVTMHVR
jgi:hypothetical protein